MANEASVGGFLAETASLVLDKPREVGLYVVVVGGLAAIGVVLGLSESTAASFGFGVSIDASDSIPSALYELLLGITNIVASYFLLKQFLAARGRLRESGAGFWAFLGMSILSWLGIIVGLILLIVPGIILLVRWSAATGFLLGRGEGVIDSLSASWDATRGHSWPIFFAAIIMFIGLAIGGGVVGGLFGIAGTVPLGIASALVEAAAGAVSMAFGIAIFCLVADDTEQLAETFA